MHAAPSASSNFSGSSTDNSARWACRPTWPFGPSPAWAIAKAIAQSTTVPPPATTTGARSRCEARRSAFRPRAGGCAAEGLPLTEAVVLSTTRGRLRVPMRLSPYHRYWLARARSVQGGRLLRDRRGRWYVHLTVRIETPEAAPTGRVVGVDLGQRLLAALSTGARFPGGALKTKRLHYRAKRAEIRSKLVRPFRTHQKRQVPLAQLSGRERRFVRQVLHEASRRIVDSLAPGDVLAIEDLRGLRGRTKRKGKAARHLHQLWPYGLFRHLLEYKARLKGVRVVVVDPAHTSQTCPRCGHIDRRNRRSGRLFRCRACGFQHNADVVAALNLARRAGSEGMGRCQPAPGAIPAVDREGKPTTSVVGS